MTRRFGHRLVLAALIGAALGCGPAADRKTYSREKLMDPTTCKGCHPNQYQEWASSMHAYASDDPVFLAMNKRGQREAKIGKFCVNCHAPMAVREGYTTDGLNLKDAPPSLRGVTCYFCHNAQAVTDTHNNPIQLANDTTMRAGLANPRKPGVHGVAYSALHDGEQFESAKLCGSCHDIVNGHGVHLERTYEEWQKSLFSHGHNSGLTCNQCHMQRLSGVAAVDPPAKPPLRTLHMHLFPAVDTALTEFPDQDVQRAAVDCELKSAVLLRLCPSTTPVAAPVTVTLETNAGHRFPSGASADRRMWVELTAYDKNDKIIYSSGSFKPGDVIEAPDGAGEGKPWVFHDAQYDKDGNEALMFWDAVPHEPDASTLTCGNTLPEAVTAVAGSHSCEKPYRFVPAAPPTDHIRVQVHLQPIGREILDSLVTSGDLDPAIAAKMPSLTLTDTITEWHASDGFGCVTETIPSSLDCPNDYICLLYPDLTMCGK